jgi:hypothetical protein
MAVVSTAVEHRGLPRLDAAGNYDVHRPQHGGLQEPCFLSGEAAELDEVCEPGRAEHELADVLRSTDRLPMTVTELWR